ncbi:uncharacterized protein LOC118484774 isoform X2 [Helianthus annuus]|uniref:uncharacterized protein LOC118484774 isoform X2 n=1 Tax=Helianthus annuus TaxID=4232 RepID=UPI001652F08D|nr:uncharacterized protein LOC118484774 isoform X2 [Helianthus annuus]
MEVGNTKGVFVFSEKSLLTSYVCAVQTTRRRFALQTVCFLEDISLKNVFKPMGVLFPTQTWSSVFPHLPTSSNPLSTPLLLISKQRHLFSILFFPTLVPSPSHPTQPPLRSSFSSYVAGHHHLLLHSHQQHLPQLHSQRRQFPHLHSHRQHLPLLHNHCQHLPHLHSHRRRGFPSVFILCEGFPSMNVCDDGEKMVK